MLTPDHRYRPLTLYHDPSSEPSRAVRWFVLDAGLEVDAVTVRLDRGEQREAWFLELNPCGEVPVLTAGTLRLSEAAAIMIFLAELHGISGAWVGPDPAARATTHRLLSWYHGKLRRSLTYDYLLPMFYAPFMTGVQAPDDGTAEARREAAAAVLGELERLIAPAPFLGGGEPVVADYLLAAEMTALDVDPQGDALMAGCPGLVRWLAAMRERPGYAASHAAWLALIPAMRRAAGVSTPADPT